MVADLTRWRLNESWCIDQNRRLVSTREWPQNRRAVDTAKDVLVLRCQRLYQWSLIMTHRDGFPRLSDSVPHGLRCPASPRHALLAENLGKPSL